MLFNSLSFAIFLPVVFAIYWILPHKFRWILLLAASYWFYMSWHPEYIVLILFTTVVSYAAGIAMEKQSSAGRKKLILALACVASLGVLFFFKYFNFVSRSLARVLSCFGMPVDPIVLKFLLPVGISFYTFQTLSYVIDVYRGTVPAEHHFGRYATFVSFFPQLVAGPIERTNNLLPQIKEEHVFDYKGASHGLKLMAWGFFKKIVIADTVSRYTGSVFDNPQSYQGFALVLATLLFTLQIYCDFSGYSEIAKGSAELMGIRLMTNFKSPYFSASIREFWSRWHISLSTWFRDYVYIPLGGNRVGKPRKAFNLLLTFLVSGLWHGANWTFVVWGGIHGIAQILEDLFFPGKKGKEAKGIVRAIRVLVVFAFCSFAWIFFASDSIGDAFYVIGHAFDGIAAPIPYLRSGFTTLGVEKRSLFFFTISLGMLLLFDLRSMKTDVILAISKKKTFVRWTIYILFLLWMILNVPTTKTQEFIYFQF
ncbi:MAG: MBOAT family protein [Lachnospiraceae bacterium]|nr:MBOAT family protein [Lachnospiraceae bacterium]